MGWLGMKKTKHKMNLSREEMKMIHRIRSLQNGTHFVVVICDGKRPNVLEVYEQRPKQEYLY